MSWWAQGNFATEAVAVVWLDVSCLLCLKVPGFLLQLGDERLPPTLFSWKLEENSPLGIGLPLKQLILCFQPQKVIWYKKTHCQTVCVFIRLLNKQPLLSKSTNPKSSWPTWMVSVLCFTNSAMLRSANATAKLPAMVETTSHAEVEYVPGGHGLSHLSSVFWVAELEECELKWRTHSCKWQVSLSPVPEAKKSTSFGMRLYVYVSNME